MTVAFRFGFQNGHNGFLDIFFNPADIEVILLLVFLITSEFSVLRKFIYSN